MDHRRQAFPSATLRGGESYGRRVREGAEDSIAAARRFECKCLACGRRPPRPPVVMFGVSMGGNASGLAVAARAKRADGSPLLDHWFDIEGVTNVIETCFDSRAVAGPPLYTNGADDGTVPFNQSPEMFARLVEVGIPTDFWAVGRRGDARVAAP